MSDISKLKYALKTIHDICDFFKGNCDRCPLAWIDDDEIHINCTIGYPWRPPCNWNPETMVCGDAWKLNHGRHEKSAEPNPMKKVKTKSLPTKEFFGSILSTTRRTK